MRLPASEPARRTRRSGPGLAAHHGRVKRLALAPEHLDGPLTDVDVLAGNLADLGRINRVFGGVDLSRRAIEALVVSHAGVGDSPLRLVDIGTGGADIPLALIRAWRRHGARLSVTAIDSRPEVLRAAVAVRPSIEAENDLRLELADGLDLPYPDDAFNVAHASLVLHHLEPDEAVVLLREMARVADRGVVINDLARGWLPWLGAWLMLHLITRNRFTLHDGPLSVRRAYTLGEARQLLALSGLRVVREQVGFAGHRWALAAVRAAGPIGANPAPEAPSAPTAADLP
jgi:ubiquinone/menaquinone biosynthesis C-methylase UbiE